VIVYNHDVAALCRQTHRIGVELYKSVSSSTSGMNKFDAERTKRNVAAVRSLLAWVVAEPQMDLPESHPLAIELPDPVRFDEVESDSINLALDLCHVCMLELQSSQSAREAAGMISFDAKRLVAVLEKMDSLIDNHVATSTPLDLPESVPSQPGSGSGATGTGGQRA
jgi:hypothetical protein